MLLLMTSLFHTHFAIVHGILGGTEIEIQNAPYQLNYGDICGAVLIHIKWAMTTAHCGKEAFLRIGSKYRLKGPKVKIRSHIVHAKFGKLHMFDYDIQLLEFYRRLKVTDNVSPINIGEGFNEDHIYVAGWGYAKEKGEYQDELQGVKLKLVPMRKCQSIKQKWYNNTLTERMFCAGGAEKDACQGDSGGAAVSFGSLVGLASFGFGCGRNYPGVYLNVSDPNIRGWIRNYTGV